MPKPALWVETICSIIVFTADSAPRLAPEAVTATTRHEESEIAPPTLPGEDPLPDPGCAGTAGFDEEYERPPDPVSDILSLAEDTIPARLASDTADNLTFVRIWRGSKNPLKKPREPAF